MRPNKSIPRRLARFCSGLLPALLAVGSLGELLRAQTVPATSPTTAATAPQTSTPATPPQPGHRARVDLADGKLTVTAENSSLNQILRDIGRLTGMTITGGVLEERVFGVYGPADTSAVLSALLNGTGSNVLLIEDSGQSPRQLILTPRQGGPTPPNPSAFRDAQEDTDLPPELAPRGPRQFNTSSPPQPSAQLPAQPTNTPSSVPSSSPGAQPSPALPGQPAPSSSPVAPAADTTTQQSPNGVKTPQQIYDQLIKLQQQQQAKPPQ